MAHERDVEHAWSPGTSVVCLSWGSFEVKELARGQKEEHDFARKGFGLSYLVWLSGPAASCTSLRN